MAADHTLMCALSGQPRDPGTSFAYFQENTLQFSSKLHVRSVEFNRAQFDWVPHTITFTELVTELEALGAVEEFLSQPLTSTYLQDILEHIFVPLHVKTALRGDCLGTAILLNAVTVDPNGTMHLQVSQ